MADLETDYGGPGATYPVWDALDMSLIIEDAARLIEKHYNETDNILADDNDHYIVADDNAHIGGYRWWSTFQADDEVLGTLSLVVDESSILVDGQEWPGYHRVAIGPSIQMEIRVTGNLAGRGLFVAGRDNRPVLVQDEVGMWVLLPGEVA